MLQEKFLRAIDWFIAPEARTDAAILGRARIFVFSHLFGPAMGHSISIYLYISDKNRGFPFWVIVASITLFWTLPFGLKLIGRLQPLAWFSVENLTFVTLFGSYYYGGVSSPFLPWLLIALLLGFFYVGDRPFLVLGIFCANVAGFYLAYEVQGGFPQHIALTDLSGVGIVSVTSATIYMAMMALYYAAVRKELKRSRGKEVVTTGDGAFVVLHDPRDAHRFAVAVDRAARSHNETHSEGLETGQRHFRMGVATGEFSFVPGDAGSPRIAGLGITRATRLQERLPPSTYRRPFLGTGLCGALTTFSTLQIEVIRLGRDGLELEPTYTAKAFACALEHLVRGERVVFAQTFAGSRPPPARS